MRSSYPARRFSGLALFLAVLLTGLAVMPVVADEQAAPDDSFAETFRQLQERLDALEARNAALEEKLRSVTPAEADASKPASEAEAAVPESDTEGDNALSLSQATDKRLTELEESISEKAKKDAEAAAKKKKDDAKKEKKWFEKYTIRGYSQFRFNEVLDNDAQGRPHLVGDSSVGDNQSFLIRRARLILSGDVSDHLSLYFQPDFASGVPGSPDANQFAQIRDLYGDIFLDDEKEYRFRVGQSKVPYGWENLQSSSNRLPLDRNDALNSAVRNERDLGVFFYYTPVDVQDTFKYVMDEGLKGSGNYGMFGVGVYNGQGGSFREQNDDLHTIARVTLPFWLENRQLVEVSMQGYTGRYSVLSSTISPLGVGPAVRPAGTVETAAAGIRDERLAWTFVYYPQPFGFQSEWTIGRGPALNDAQTAVTDSALYGGYAMAMYRHRLQKGELLPFLRWNYYQGGYKTERNAPFSEIEELEVGTEWQFSKSLELVTMYTMTDRTNTQAISRAGARSYEQFEGNLLRFQVQINY